MQSVQQITEVQNNSISTLLADRDSYLAQLNIMDQDNGTNVPTTPPSGAQILAKQVILNSWKDNFNSRIILKQQIGSQRLNTISQAQQLLQNISSTTTQEASWKTIRTIHLNRVIGIADDESTLSQLRDIAALCPEQAGNSAILALYMLPSREITTLLPDEETGLMGNCTPRSEKDHYHNDVLFETMKVSPNPTKDWISVELPNQVTGIWEVVDLRGRIVRSGKIEKSLTFLIETATIPGGSYLLKVNSDEGSHFTQKFVISY